MFPNAVFPSEVFPSQLFPRAGGTSSSGAYLLDGDLLGTEGGDELGTEASNWIGVEGGPFGDELATEGGAALATEGDAPVEPETDLVESVLATEGGLILGTEGGDVLGLEQPTYSGFDVVSAVIAWWAAMPAVRALTSDGKLWHRRTPEDIQLPYATIFRVSEAVESWTTGYPFKRTSIQLNLHADTDLAAYSLGLAVRLALGPTPASPNGAALAVNGSRVCHCLPDDNGIDVGEGLGPGGRDCWVAAETFDIAWTP